MSKAPRRLPDHPSKEHLRKEAKRRAKDDDVALAAAQRRIAREHGVAAWADLMRAVDAKLGEAAPSDLALAAGAADVAKVKALLDAGASPDGAPRELNSPLFRVCDSKAEPNRRLAVAKLLLDAGAFTRGGCEGGATPLHAAARRGPAAMVELLLKNGAVPWQPDDDDKRPYHHALENEPDDRERILFLLSADPRIEDEEFKAAVAAIQNGDLDALGRLLDANPALLTERAIEADVGPKGYFSDPKLFWFVANNPTLIPEPPDNVVDVAQFMIDRGVAQEDLEYALGLVMTDGAMPKAKQIALMRTLIEAGARVDPDGMLWVLGHGQTVPTQWLLDNGLVEVTSLIAAGMGLVDDLARLLPGAAPDDLQTALCMAVVNRRPEAARLCLEAGADPNKYMPAHAHSTPLHQAALYGDMEMMQLLVDHGARLDIEDKLWCGTPLGWAHHGNQPEAFAYLKSLLPPEP